MTVRFVFLMPRRKDGGEGDFEGMRAGRKSDQREFAEERMGGF